MMRFLMTFLLLSLANAAQAHKPSDSYLILKIDGAKVQGQWDIALRDLDFAQDRAFRKPRLRHVHNILIAQAGRAFQPGRAFRFQQPSFSTLVCRPGDRLPIEPAPEARRCRKRERSGRPRC